MKKIFYLIAFIVLSMDIFAQNPITPNGKEVSASALAYLNQDQISYINNQIATNYSFVETIQSPEPYFGTFNCHFFAWHNNQGYTIWSGSGNIWENGTPPQYKWFGYPTDYFSDGSYSNPSGYTSYVQTTESSAPVAVYRYNGTITHSARRLSGSTDLISKWGAWSVYLHGPTEVPSSYGSITEKYKINPNYRPVGIGDPGGRDWGTINNAINGIPTNGSLISVLSGTNTITSNVIVPTGVTLTIKSGTTVKLNGFSIKSTGGTITIESGVTQNYVELKDGSTIKGLYSSLNTAVSDAISGQTINIFNSSSLTANVSIPSGITVNIKSSSTLNLNGYKLLLAGGSVVVESGANFPYAKLKNNYSTLLGYYPNIESAISDAQSGYTVQLPSITYTGNISLTNKGGIKLKGAGVGSTTINGNITITNSTYAQVSDFTMGNYKSITVNGGDRPYVYNIGFNNTRYNYIFVYDGYNTDLSGINNVGGSTEPAWRFYNSYTGNISYSSIEGYDFGINAASYSEIAMSSMSFCNNMVDLWASSGCWIYATHSSLSYNGAYYGNCTFGLMYDPCGSKAERRDDSQLAKNAVEQFDSFNEANSAFRALLMDENISKESKLTENSKNKIKGVIEQYKSILGTNISKNEIKEALSKLSVCNRMLDEETVFADYVTDLISNKKVPSEMKRFLIPSLVKKGSYSQTINLIDEISAYQDLSEDLKNELLYEKGTIQKYYLNEADQSEKVFAELYKNAGDHILVRYAKAQLDDESGLDGGSNPKTGDNSEVDNGFAISSYPNPFNPTATIEYQIPKDGLVNLVVYNTLGQVVAELVNEHQSSGKYSVQFSASNLPSGIYFYKIESGSFSKSMKMLLSK